MPRLTAVPGPGADAARGFHCGPLRRWRLPWGGLSYTILGSSCRLVVSRWRIAWGREPSPAGCRGVRGPGFSWGARRSRSAGQPRPRIPVPTIRRPACASRARRSSSACTTSSAAATCPAARTPGPGRGRAAGGVRRPQAAAQAPVRQLRGQAGGAGGQADRLHGPRLHPHGHADQAAAAAGRDRRSRRKHRPSHRPTPTRPKRTRPKRRRPKRRRSRRGGRGSRPATRPRRRPSLLRRRRPRRRRPRAATSASTPTSATSRKAGQGDHRPVPCAGRAATWPAG